MTDVTTVSVATAYFDAWNAGDLERLAQQLAPDFRYESDTTPLPIEGRAAMVEYARMFLQAFPDLHFRIGDMLASGEQITVCWTASGTHSAEIFGTPASGRHGEVRGCSIARVKDDVLSEMHSYWDLATLLRQIGAMPVRATNPEMDRWMPRTYR